MTDAYSTDLKIQRVLQEQAIAEAGGAVGGVGVGVVIARGGEVLSTGYKGERKGQHAEQVALEKAREYQLDIRETQLYTTLEPCLNIEGKRIPCAERIAEAGIREVYIGEYDRNPRIYRKGWRYLMDHGVRCFDFPQDLRDLAHQASNEFTSLFTRKTGWEGGAKFDFTQNGGHFEISATDEPSSVSWITSWSNCGRDAIYFCKHDNARVAKATYARDFFEIDDAGALDYEGHVVRLGIGEIGVLQRAGSYLFCKVERIDPTIDYGGDGSPSVKFQWKMRLDDNNSDTIKGLPC